MSNSASAAINPPYTIERGPNGKPIIVFPQRPIEDQLAFPAEALYGYLGKQAIAMEAPLEWAVVTLLALWAGVGIKYRTSSPLPIRPTVYVALLGDKGTGKSRTVSVAKLMMKTDRRDYFQEMNLNSDRAFDSAFPLDEALKDNGENMAVPHLVYQDEMRTLLEKASIQNSTLASTLCSLYYRSTGANADKKGKHYFAVVLSMLGCLKVKNVDEFRELFCSSTTHGLADRYILAPGPATWKWNNHWEVPHIPMVEQGDDYDYGPDRPLEVTVDVAIHAFDRIDEWEQQGKERGRLGEIAKRVAIIYAAVNNDGTITPACVDASIAFAEWQERVRAVYSPSDAQTRSAIISNKIMAAFLEKERERPAQWVNFRQLSNSKGWGKDTGGYSDYVRERDALVRGAWLEEERGPCDERGNPARLRYPKYRIMTDEHEHE